MKTDLTKILTVSGHRGLFLYVAQARNGVIAESLSDKKRMVFDAKSRITTLADIAIYTQTELFLALQNVLDGKEAPSAKSSDEELKSLFLKAIPDYDPDRFYISHMKKVVEWYNELLKYASLDFETEDKKDEA